MTYFSINSPYQSFTDANGDPLENGFLWIGEAYKNPITNPIEVFWDRSFLYPAAQPLSVNNGYISKIGSPSNIYINPNINNYSITIQNKNGEIVFSDNDARSLINILNYNAINIKWFGAFGDGIRDDTQSIITAVAYAEDGIGGNTVYFPKGHYVISAPIETNAVGTMLIGAGPYSTRILATHKNGDVIRLKREYNSIANMEIISSSSRSGVTNDDGFGLRLEYDDIVETTDTRTRICTIRNMVIRNQPATGIYLVGPAIAGSRIESSRIKDNRGHGIAMDTGYLSNRTYKTSVAKPGLINIENVLLQGNAGHGLAAGHPDDPSNTPALRVYASNLECTENADDASVRYSYDQVWLIGQNHEVRTSVFQTDDPLGGGIRVDGRNYHLKNNRFINLAYSIYIDDVGPLSTQGVFIDGITVLTNTQDVAVIVAPGASNVRISNFLPDKITKLITPDVPGVMVDFTPQIIYKESTQVINNSSLLQDDIHLKYYLKGNIDYMFECCIETDSGSAAPNIKIGFIIPSGAIIHWSPVNGMKVDTAGNVVAQNAITGSGSSTSFLSGSNKNIITIVGNVITGSGNGYLQLQWAQNAATAVDTKIYARASYLKIWRLY